MSEPYVRPDVRQFLDFLNALPGPRTHELEPAEARAMMLASRQAADAPVGELSVIRDLSFAGPAGDVPLRLYDAREEREAGPLMLFFHGGGFVLGDLDSHEPFCAEMARALDMPVLGRLSAGARASLAGRNRGFDRGCLLGRGKPGGVGPE